jgi:hypothetical protein
MKRIIAFFFLVLAICTGCSPDFDTPLSPSDNVAFVLTTDYSGSASYSTVELDTLKSYLDLGPGKTHTDAYCRYFNDMVYV